MVADPVQWAGREAQKQTFSLDTRLPTYTSAFGHCRFWSCLFETLRGFASGNKSVSPRALLHLPAHCYSS